MSNPAATLAHELQNLAQETPEPRLSLVESAYAALKTSIMESDFPPGLQVSAQELAVRFGMSRTPIHEACLRLQEEGLVRILPKKGILICALVPEDLREIYEVIIAIEGDAAALAARLPEPERRRVAGLLEAQTEWMSDALAAGDLAGRGQADAAFHHVLVQGCGNRRFAGIIQTVNDQSHRARTITVKMRSNLQLSVPEHRSIAAAIAAGDAAKAFDAARLHRIRARDEILPLIEKFGLKHL